MTLQQSHVRPKTSLLEVGFNNYFTEMITILNRLVACKFGWLPWRSMSQHDLAAKSCAVHNCVIWSRILQLFHRNDHHIETMCHAQHLGRYFEGQRSQHDLEAKSYPAHNFVIWSRILQLFHRNYHHIETISSAQHLGCFYTLNFVCDITLTEVYLPVSKTYSGSITRFNWLRFSVVRTIKIQFYFIE
jgi:hypothetical protein